MFISTANFSIPCCSVRFPVNSPKCSAHRGPIGRPTSSARSAEPIDFVGVNYYLRLVVCDDPAGGPARARIVDRPNCPRTATDWEIYPQGLAEILTMDQDSVRRSAALHHRKRRRFRRRFARQMAPSMIVERVEYS